MVKLNYEDFVSKVDKMFSDSKDKHSIYFTFKRVYTENFKYKQNQKNRKLRREDQLKQESDQTKQFNVLIRAKLRKMRAQTIIEPKDLSGFHNIFTKIMSLHFITQINEPQKKQKLMPSAKGKSSTQKRKEKRLKRLALSKPAIKKQETDKA